MPRPSLAFATVTLAAATMSLASACASTPAGSTTTAPAAAPAKAPPDRGSPDEVRTQSASLDGVDVVVPCRDPGAVGVLGRGPNQPPAIEGDGAAYNAWARDLSARTEAALGDVVAGVGWGIGCRDGLVGPTVYVQRYADVDATVLALVEFVRREGLGVPFVVLVVHDVELLGGQSG